MLRVQFAKVDFLKERVLLDVPDIVTQPSGLVNRKQTPQQVLGGTGEIFGESYLSALEERLHIELILGIVLVEPNLNGGSRAQQLIGQTTESPPVGDFREPLHKHALGRKETRGAAKRVGSMNVVLGANPFGESKVPQLNVSLTIHQNVLRLHVPIHDVLRVKILQGE